MPLTYVFVEMAIQDVEASRSTRGQGLCNHSNHADLKRCAGDFRLQGVQLLAGCLLELWAVGRMNPILETQNIRADGGMT